MFDTTKAVTKVTSEDKSRLIFRNIEYGVKCGPTRAKALRGVKYFVFYSVLKLNIISMTECSLGVARHSIRSDILAGADL